VSPRPARREEAGPVDLEVRDLRFLRAARQVLTRYRLVREKDRPDGTVTIRVEGGEAPYTIVAHRDWAHPPRCSCPDAERRAKAHNAGYCKHAIAALLQHEDLRCQLLELFL
jgi:uncharacterized Zn finger protein